MKNLVKIIFLSLSVVFFQHAYSQTDKQSAEEKAWKEYMSPGEAHKMLARSSGEWNEELTMWMDAGSPPTKHTATAVTKMIMDGRYQQTLHKGTFNGMPFEGVGITGYDNAKKVFFSTWIDNMGTGIMYSEGKWKEPGKSIEFTGKTFDPVSGKELIVRDVLRVIDNNTQLMEMYTTKDGKEYKSMEIRLTRKM